MDTDDIGDKFEDMEGRIENFEENMEGFSSVIGILASAILIQQECGQIPPDIMVKLEKYAKWGEKKK